MNSISNYLSLNIKKIDTEARNFRESLINEFCDRILQDRKGTEFEPKTPLELKKFKRGVALKINTNPFLRETWQLENFLKDCRAASTFSKRFYWKLKVK